jgi:hypothetical protein
MMIKNASSVKGSKTDDYLAAPPHRAWEGKLLFFFSHKGSPKVE